MSELIAMRQRIKAIQTIKKVTQAMRLIALSTQMRTKGKTTPLQIYIHELQQLSERINHDLNYHYESAATPHSGNEDLVILIGSQKGLCGNFNIQLSNFFEKEFLPFSENMQIIVVGKKIIDSIEQINLKTIHTFPDFLPGKVIRIAKELTDHIWHRQPFYSRVSIVFNQLKSGTIAIPKKLDLIPFKYENAQPQLREQYHWEQNPITIIKTIFYNLLNARIQSCLLTSLLAEQMARFISMHQATKNASDLLDTMHINYNKLRQAKITRDLTDLIASINPS